MRYTWAKAIVDKETRNTIITLKDENGGTSDALELTPFESDALAGRLNVLNATRMQLKAHSTKDRAQQKTAGIWGRMRRGKD